MNIVLYKDFETEMLSIDVNQKNVFYGNFWDFSAPKDLEELLTAISLADPSIKVTQLKATIED